MATFKETIQSGSRTDKFVATLTLASGNVLEISDTDLWAGSVSVDNQCVNGGNLEFGCVYLGRFIFKLITDSLDRFDLYNSEVVPVYSLLVDDTWYDVPLGIYTISNAERKNNYISVTCYDRISKFDKKCKNDVTGTPYQIVTEICSLCGVTLDTTQEEFEAFPNGTMQDTLRATKHSTYRDMLKTLAQILGCFVIANKSGNIEFRQFGSKATHDIPKSVRFNTGVSDYICQYSGIVAKGPVDDCEAGVLESENGGIMIMTLDNNPLIEFASSQAAAQTYVSNLWDYLSTISYRPCTLSLMNDPSLECGDAINVYGTPGIGDITSFITHYVWRYRGRQSIKGVGSDPYLELPLTREQKIVENVEADAPIATPEIPGKVLPGPGLSIDEKGLLSGLRIQFIDHESEVGTDPNVIYVLTEIDGNEEYF